MVAQRARDLKPTGETAAVLARSRPPAAARGHHYERRKAYVASGKCAAIIARETAAHWRPKFAAADCCVTLMASLEEALHDPHFVERGLFAHQVAGASGKTMPALPVPIAASLRGAPEVKLSPKLGADNHTLG